MLALLIFIFSFVKVKGEVPVLEGATPNSAGGLQLQGSEGYSLIITCTSNLTSLYLEYNNVQYNETVSTNGSFSVNFTLVPTRADDRETVICFASNTTNEERFNSTAKLYLNLKPTSEYITGGGTYEDGDNVTVTCSVGGSRPAANLVLYNTMNLINETELETLTSYDNATDTYNVSVVYRQTVNGSFNGNTFSCHISIPLVYANFIGAKLTVNFGPYPDQAKLTHFPDRVFEGSSDYFRCTSGRTHPAATFHWYNGTEPFTPPKSPVITEDPGGFFNGKSFWAEQEWDLVLSRYHTGSIIKCVVIGTNNRSVATTTEIQDVLYKPEIQVNGHSLIDPDSGDYIYDEGETLNLTCDLISANPWTTVIWKYKTGPDNYSAPLVIPSLGRTNDQDLFICEASNSAGTTSINVRINIQYGPVLYSGYTMGVPEGGNISISCDVMYSKPPATIWWERGDKSYSLEGAELTLTNISRDQGGEYICYAAANRTRANGTIEVFTANTTYVVDVRYGPGNSIRIEPNITSMEVNEGDTVPAVTCSADCNPPCYYHWTNMGSGATLNLGKANRFFHIGKQTCTAENLIQGVRPMANVSFGLYIRYQPFIESVDLNSFNSYKEGEEVKVTCKVKSYPPSNVTWSIEGETLEPGSYTSNTSVSCDYDCTTTDQLIIHHARCLDSGRYFTCNASNDIGDPVVRNSLNRMYVRCHPRPASGISVYNYSLRSGDQVNLTASFLSIPLPTVVWYFRASPTSSNNSLRVDDSSRDFRSMYFTTTYTLEVFHPWHFGQYLAVADNYNAEDIDSVIVYNIEEDPSIRPGYPHKPFDLNVTCSSTSALLTWTSPYNGGSQQTFTVYYAYFHPRKIIKGPSGIADTGENTTISTTIQPLDTGYPFFFTMESQNGNGYTDSDEFVNCTTGEQSILPTGKPSTPKKSSVKGGVIGGAVVGGLVLIAILVITGIVVFKRYQTQKGNVKFSDLHLSFYNGKS